MVTVVPPDVGPWLGSRLVITGEKPTVKVATSLCSGAIGVARNQPVAIGFSHSQAGHFDWRNLLLGITHDRSHAGRMGQQFSTPKHSTALSPMYSK